MVRWFFIFAVLGIAVAFVLLIASICCFEHVPSGAAMYRILWPTTQLLDSVVDPVRPARSDYFVFLAAIAKGIPYGIIGILLQLTRRRALKRKRLA